VEAEVIVTGAGELVSRTLDAYRLARSKMEGAFAASSASAIVSEVNRGERARQGKLPDGLEYFVHGIGYTVTLPAGGQVHIDSSPDGDSLSIYDIQHFMETSGEENVPGLTAITDVCDEKVRSGELSAISEWQFLLPRHAA
jgi:hypothetical protein